MKNIIIAVLFIVLFYGCDKGDSRPVPEGMVRGVVLETIDGGGYTYMKLEEEEGTSWVAAVEMKVTKGDTVYYSAGSMVMKDFHSKSMNKTFDKIIFADKATKDPWGDGSGNPNGNMMMGEKNPHSSAVHEKDANISIQPDEGGLSIEQIYAQRNELNGKTIKVKGQIVKYNAGIMNKNWIHIQDGSGTKNDYDLAITTDEEFAVGAVVSFEGVLSVEKDFGSGYKFTVIIENAKSVKALTQS